MFIIKQIKQQTLKSSTAAHVLSVAGSTQRASSQWFGHWAQALPMSIHLGVDSLKLHDVMKLWSADLPKNEHVAIHNNTYHHENMHWLHLFLDLSISKYTSTHMYNPQPFTGDIYQTPNICIITFFE